MDVLGDSLADALEVYLATQSQNACSEHELEKFADQSLGVSQPQLSFGVHLMRRRANLLGDLYPFRFEPGAVVRGITFGSSRYALALAASVTTLSFSADLSTIEPDFDQLVLDSIRTWLGVGAKGVVFAWPPVGGRPTSFPEAITWLVDQMDIPVGHAYRPPAQKDGGVDVVAWRPFADRRPGFPIVLAQCTLQQDLVPKAKDIDLELWKNLLNLEVSPLPVLATPQVLSASSSTWSEIGRRCVPFDRLRLLSVLGSDCGPPRSKSRLRAVKLVLDIERNRLESL
jgi:hypothetical protein